MSDKSKACLIQGKTGPWEVVIGLEVHAQVTSKAKLFSGAATDFGASPNSQVSFVDAGFPGMLPVINEFCVEQAVKTGMGLHAQINMTSIFDRKNYFYPDLPSGYQISQFKHPIVGEGYLDIDLKDGTTKRIDIERIHLEQDAGKSMHDQAPGKSHIDLNRSGVALMEIVTRPDMRSAEEAMAFFKKLRGLVRCLGTCDGNMEQGSMRADVNVSLRRPGDKLGIRTETKNVNSIRFVGQAINYEIKRQMAVLESGKQVTQETRLFDPGKGETRPMRSKEEAHDYRYFPDPDLPPLHLTKEMVQRIKDALPELPDTKKQRFITDFGLTAYDAGVLTEEMEVADFFEQAVAACKDPGKSAKTVANWMTGELFAALNRDSLTIQDSKVATSALGALVDLILSGTISGKIAKDVFVEMWETGKSPSDIVKEKGLEQVSDSAALTQCIDEVLANNANMVQQYKSGKDKLFGFFVGQVMKATSGKANPKMVNEILKQKLGAA
ncbi:MAG: Asp-tRNA(Asn)/Glu-tRNA(Gln) amidotransferase subunit GatB [Pseudomonadota bacterium]